MSETIVTDAKGRKFLLRKLTVLDQIKVLRAVGAAQSSNQPYVEIVTMASSVSSIDGVPVIMPASERQIDALIDKIGDEGFSALMLHMKREIAAVEAAALAAADGGEAKPDPLAPSA